MRISFVSQNNVNVYPGMHQLAMAMSRRGAEVQLVARDRPGDGGMGASAVCWIEAAPILSGPLARVPGLRANFHGMYRSFVRFRPDWIVAQQDYLVPALIYGLGRRSVRIAGYFPDFHLHTRCMEVVSRLARRLDAYVEVCDMRLRWRQEAWPSAKATPFIIRQAPFRTHVAPAAHAGPVRLIHTGSTYVVDRMDPERLSRFMSRLCGHGVAVDWYLSGASREQADASRLARARSLCGHPLFNVREAVGKAQLMSLLGRYDAGLHWAPLAEQDRDRHYFQSAASNKIGEYIAAGLIVAHAGNPGLAYLPADVATVFDPTDPEAGADQLAAALSDRTTVERRRQAAHRYHLAEMSFEAQAAAFIDHLLAS